MAVAVQEAGIADMSDVELHESLVALRRDIDRSCAREAQLLAMWDARKVWADDGSRSPGHRFARETGLSVKDAKALMHRAGRLASMPLTMDAFVSGSLSSSRVDLLVRTRQPNVAGVFERDESLPVSLVQELSFPKAVQALKYWEQRADEDGAKDKTKKQLEARSAHAARTLDDTVDLTALFEPVGGEVFLDELQRLEDELFQEDWAETKAIHGDNVTVADLRRTPAQRRCDALVLMAQRSASLTDDAEPARPLVTILVGEDSLKHVCELASGAIITPEAIVPWPLDATIESIIHGDPKRVLAVTRQRSFRGAVRRAIEVRDRHCQHPSGCDVPARKCQVDHRVAYVKTQETSQQDGQLLCPRHNQAKGREAALHRLGRQGGWAALPGFAHLLQQAASK